MQSFLIYAKLIGKELNFCKENEFTKQKLKEQIKKIENETGLSKGYINLEEMWRDLDKED